MIFISFPIEKYTILCMFSAHYFPPKPLYNH